MRSEYYFKRVDERDEFVVYEVRTPAIITRRLANKSGYISKIVKRSHFEIRSCDIQELGTYSIVKIFIKKKDLSKSRKKLKVLTNDIWANNTLRKILGR